MTSRLILIARVMLGIYVICFGLGAFNHARDFLELGWRPYDWAPRLLEAFWTLLIILDSLAVATLLSRYKAVGLLLSLGIMIADVAANTYALVVLDIPAFGLSVPLQATFLGFILGSLPFVWPRSTPALDDTHRPDDGPNQQPNDSEVGPQQAEPPLENRRRVR